MEKSSFAAWSIYTGPSNLKEIVPNSSWVIGQWNAINATSDPNEIQKDIDERIKIVIEAFKQYCSTSTALNKHFAIPEFFFRCKEGPYPSVKINGKNPFEYIKEKCNEQFQKTISELSKKAPQSSTYTIVLGSILTSNIENYQIFLKSEAVKDRLNRLNKNLNFATPKQTTPKKSIADFKSLSYNINEDKEHPQQFVWKRQLIYKPKRKPQKLLKTSLRKSSGLINSSVDIDELMSEFRSYPLCTVRNRGIYFYWGSDGDLQTIVYEKQYQSTVDLTMGVKDGDNLAHGNMITQWMANYPSYNTNKGDKQTGKQYETNARFDFSEETQKKMDIGIEICLDHRLQRLRRTVNMTRSNGASLDNYPILKQFVPSGGMQILSQAVATDGNSVVFNADGCEPIFYEYVPGSQKVLNGQSGPFKGVTCGVYNVSYQSRWDQKASSDRAVHYSHSQLAFTTPNSIMEGYNNALGNNNFKATTFIQDETNENKFNNLTDKFSVKAVKVNASSTSTLFCAGLGQLHIYSPN